MTDQTWFAEAPGENKSYEYRCSRKIFSGRSRFQQIDIVDTLEFGKMLFLDGIAQSSLRDEFIYHEAVVHPAMLAHPDPKSVCVIGGSEGATIREVFRHPGVNRVVMVDIDEELVNLCKLHLAEYSQGAYDDLRLELRFGDGRKYIEETDETFDVVIVDLSDPVPDSPAVFLFTREFYQAIADRLSPLGTACFQGESLQPWRVTMHARMVNTLKAVFPHVATFPYYQPCFHEIHGMILVSKADDPRTVDLGGQAAERGLELEYLSDSYLKGLFHVPGYVEKAYRECDKIITDADPQVVDPF